MAAFHCQGLEITIISAKHLKNVNWRNGDLKPYATVYLDPDHRLSTSPDDAGSTKPVWNQRFTLPITRSLHDSVLNLEIFHYKPSDSTNPLVGAVWLPLSNLADSEGSSPQIRTLELRRPSGRPQGKVRVQFAVRERPLPPPPPPDYRGTPQRSHYYSSAPPPPPPPAYYRGFSSSPDSYYDQYSGYRSSAYYSPSPLPPLPSQQFFSRASSGSSPAGPSAPIDLSSAKDHQPPPQAPNYAVPSGPSAPADYRPYDHQLPGASSSTPPVIEAVTGSIGGLSLEEGAKYEEKKAVERAGRDFAGKESYRYTNVRGDY